MRSILPTTFALLLVACQGDDGREPLSTQLDDAFAELDGARSAVEDHAMLAAAAVDLQALRALEPAHHDELGQHMDDLGHAIGDMGGCDGVPGGDLDDMLTMHDDAVTEISRHGAAIDAATDRIAAQAEERAHRERMLVRLDALEGRGHAMMDGYGSMMCGGHHGLHDHHD